MAAWIFQGNPDLFNIDEYLAERAEILWLVRQGANLMRVGDDVYIWRAQGKRRAIRGAIAHGTIKDLGMFPDDCSELWKDGSPGVANRARIRLDDVRLTPDGGMVQADLLQSDPVLQGSQIMTFRSGTNFRLSPEEEGRLSNLWLGTGITHFSNKLPSENLNTSGGAR